MKFHFPPTIHSRSNTYQEQVKHIKEEYAEFCAAGQTESLRREYEELVDLLHSIETALRVIARVHGWSYVYGLVEQVERKNKARGYYVG